MITLCLPLASQGVVGGSESYLLITILSSLKCSLDTFLLLMITHTHYNHALWLISMNCYKLGGNSFFNECYFRINKYVLGLVNFCKGNFCCRVVGLYFVLRKNKTTLSVFY